LHGSNCAQSPCTRFGPSSKLRWGCLTTHSKHLTIARRDHTVATQVSTRKSAREPICAYHLITHDPNRRFDDKRSSIQIISHVENSAVLKLGACRVAICLDVLDDICSVHADVKVLAIGDNRFRCVLQLFDGRARSHLGIELVHS
jgi:hypothetical protein